MVRNHQVQVGVDVSITNLKKCEFHLHIILCVMCEESVQCIAIVSYHCIGYSY